MNVTEDISAEDLQLVREMVAIVADANRQSQQACLRYYDACCLAAKSKLTIKDLANWTGWGARSLYYMREWANGMDKAEATKFVSLVFSLGSSSHGPQMAKLAGVLRHRSEHWSVALPKIAELGSITVEAVRAYFQSQGQSSRNIDAENRQLVAKANRSAQSLLSLISEGPLKARFLDAVAMADNSPKFLETLVRLVAEAKSVLEENQ